MVTTALLGVALVVAWKIAGDQAHIVPSAKEYVLEVEGAAGVRLNVFLIYKPAADERPVLERATITTPWRMPFSADKCYARVDTIPEDGGGVEGDRYRIVLSCNGRRMTWVELSVQHGRHNSGEVGDLCAAREAAEPLAGSDGG